MTTDNNGGALTPLQALQERVQQQGNAVAFVQPLGGGEVREYTWKDIELEARKMAAYLQSQGMQQGDHIALVSKNCAEWIMAVWPSGWRVVSVFLCTQPWLPIPCALSWSTVSPKCCL